MSRLTFAAFAIAAATLAGTYGAAMAQNTPVSEPAKAEAPKTAPDKPEVVVAAAAPVESRITVMPQGFTSFGGAVLGDYLYAIGGHISRAHKYDNEGFNKTFYRLNLRDRTSWEVLPGGVALQSVALVSDGKRLVRVGGMSAKNAPGAKEDLFSSAEVASYDPLTRKWTDLPALPQARSSHDAVIHDGKLYVVGGWQLAGESGKAAWPNFSLVMDLKAEKPEWKKIDQPFATRAVAVATCGTDIYSIGGIGEKDPTRDVNIYDTKEGKWSKGPKLPGMAFGSSAFEMNGRVYATNLEGTLFSHAPGEAEWRVDGTLTFPRFFHRLLPVGPNELAAVAGSAMGGHVRNIEYISLDRKTPSITRYDLPAPGTAKSRQGAFFLRNSLYLFGGNNSIKDHQFGKGNFVDEAFKLSINDLSFTRIADMPVKRQSFHTFVKNLDEPDNDPVGYAFGGFGHNGTAAVSHDQVFEFDFIGNAWKESKVKLPLALTQFGLVEDGKKVYIFGGLDFDPARGEEKQFGMSDKIYLWNREAEGPNADKFIPLDVKLPISRRAFGAAVIDGKYYIVGGMTDDFEKVNQCDVFEFATGKWSTIPASAVARIAPKMVALNGKLYLVGGSSTGADKKIRFNSSVEEFDPATGKWTMIVQDLGVDLSELSAFVFNHRILLYSAQNADSVVKLIWIQP
ncbi:MAG: hypothetical protein IT462_17770 [Planctomycetes bacterium]|nr:hypothetical protein [Planctomycetota bacterium]